MLQYSVESARQNISAISTNENNKHYSFEQSFVLFNVVVHDMRFKQFSAELTGKTKNIGMC